jgi:uncharacterized protein YegP (UPF0339 family)
MIINKDIMQLQTGGSMFVTGAGLVSMPAPPLPPEAPDAPAPEFIDKTTQRKLYENGLSNDVEAFLSRYTEMANKYSSMSSMMKRSPYGREALQEMSKAGVYANKILLNYTLYKDAAQFISKEKANSQIALSPEGGVYVFEPNEDGYGGMKGELKIVSMDTYREKANRLRPLTYSQLFELRANNPELAWDTSVLASGRAAVGIDTIMSHLNRLREYVSTTGDSTTLKRDLPPAYLTALSLAGLTHNALQSYMLTLEKSPDEAYIVEDTVKSRDRAVNAIQSVAWNSMPESYRNTLRAMAAQQGGGEEAAMGLVMNMFEAMRSNSHTIEYKYDFVDDLKDVTGEKGGGKESENNVGLAEFNQSGGSGVVPLSFSIFKRDMDGKLAATRDVADFAATPYMHLPSSTFWLYDNKEVGKIAINKQAQDLTGDFIPEAEVYMRGNYHLVKLPARREGAEIHFDPETASKVAAVEAIDKKYDKAIMEERQAATQNGYNRNIETEVAQLNQKRLKEKGDLGVGTYFNPDNVYYHYFLTGEGGIFDDTSWFRGLADSTKAHQEKMRAGLYRSVDNDADEVSDIRAAVAANKEAVEAATGLDTDNWMITTILIPLKGEKADVLARMAVDEEKLKTAGGMDQNGMFVKPGDLRSY